MDLIAAKTVGPAQTGMIAWIKQPDFDHLYRFEYHPQTKTVYVIRLWETTKIADPIALNVPDLGAGINAVMIYMRGYKEARKHALVSQKG